MTVSYCEAEALHHTHCTLLSAISRCWWFVSMSVTTTL